MGIASAVLLAIYLAVAFYALASPSSDPQRGMAQGFVTLVALVILAIAGLLWYAIARNRPWLLRALFALTAYPAIMELAQLVYLALHRAS